MQQVLVLHLLPLLLKLLHNFFHIHSIPNDDRICDQVETAHLIAKLLVRLPANFPLVGVIEVRSQTMQSLPFIQLSIDSATVGFVGIPAAAGGLCAAAHEGEAGGGPEQVSCRHACGWVHEGPNGSKERE